MRIIILIISSLNFAFANWIGSTSYDKMDDVTTSYITSQVVESVAYRYGRPIKPSLIVRSNDTSREIYVIMEEYVGNIDKIIVRFDKNNKKTIRVSESTDHKALFLWGNEIESFIKNMKKANRLLIKYTPYSENPRVAEFDLKGFTKAYNKYIKPLEDKKRKKIEIEKEKLVNENKMKCINHNGKFIFDSKMNIWRCKPSDNKNIYINVTNSSECDKLNGIHEWDSIFNSWICKKIDNSLLNQNNEKPSTLINTKNECLAHNGEWEWNGEINKWECLK